MKFVAFERTHAGDRSEPPPAQCRQGARHRLRRGRTQHDRARSQRACSIALKKEAFHSSILEMELAGNTQKVLLRDYQMHPWKQRSCCTSTSSASIRQPSCASKVPLHYGDEENSPAVKTDKCLVSHVANDVEIECLATQLPGVHRRRLERSWSRASRCTCSGHRCRRPGVRVVRHGTPNPGDRRRHAAEDRGRRSTGGRTRQSVYPALHPQRAGAAPAPAASG